MNAFFDITDRTELRRLLMTLDTETQPVWGKMKARQMVEHLAEEVKWTNGKFSATCERSPGDAAGSKQRMVYTDAELPRNIYWEDLPEDYRYPTMQAAIDQVITELEDFDAYFKTPGLTTVHGGFGPLTYQEWVIYHGKHFTHHLKQFGLFPL